MCSLARLLPALFLVVALTACKGEEPWPPDSKQLTVTWKPGTAVLDEATIKSSLLNPQATDGVYRFKLGTAAAEKLTPGQFAMLTGVDIVKVDAVTTEADAIVVATKQAQLPELAQEAKGSWGLGVGYVPEAASTKQGMIVQALTPIDPLDQAKLAYNGPLGKFDFTGHMTPGPESLDLAGLLNFKSGTAQMKVAVEASLRKFRHTGEVNILGGKLYDFMIKLDEIDLDLNLELGAVALKTGEQSFRIPIEVVLPFSLGGIPLYLSIALNVSLNAALGGNCTSRAVAKFHIKGWAEFSYAGGIVTVGGNFNESTMDFGEHNAVSTIDSGVTALAEFPKVGLGVGYPKPYDLYGGASVGGYVAVRTEIVANMKMKYDTAGPYPVIVGNCYEAKQNFGVYAGGEFRLAGIKFTKESSLYTKVTTPVRTGEACN